MYVCTGSMDVQCLIVMHVYSDLLRATLLGLLAIATGVVPRPTEPFHLAEISLL